MLTELIDLQDSIAGACARYGVLHLVVFGSAVTKDFDPDRSDVDFLVEFDPSSGLGRFDAFFGLKDELEALLGRPVDLVAPAALENPYFAASVERTRHELYAA